MTHYMALRGRMMTAYAVLFAAGRVWAARQLAVSWRLWWSGRGDV